MGRYELIPDATRFECSGNPAYGVVRVRDAEDPAHPELDVQVDTNWDDGTEPPRIILPDGTSVNIDDDFLGAYQDLLRGTAAPTAGQRRVCREMVENSRLPSGGSVIGDFRSTGTLTRDGRPGFQLLIGLAAIPLNDGSIVVGGGVLVGLQQSSVPGTRESQVLIGGELSYGTPIAPVRFDIYWRGGVAINNDANPYGFAEVGGRFSIYPSQGSTGFHFLLGGGYFIELGDQDRNAPRFELGLGFSPH